MATYGFIQKTLDNALAEDIYSGSQYHIFKQLRPILIKQLPDKHFGKFNPWVNMIEKEEFADLFLSHATIKLSIPADDFINKDTEALAALEKIGCLVIRLIDAYRDQFPTLPLNQMAIRIGSKFDIDL